MASIRKWKGSWQARYRDPAGQQRSRSFARKAEAERFLAQVEVDKARGQWIDPRLGRVTFAEWTEEYLAASTHKRPTTLARDVAVLRRHLLPALGGRQMGAISPREVQAAVARMAETLAPKTVETNYGVLRAVFSAAVDADVIGRSPCRGVRLPERRPATKPMATAEDVLRLADEVPAEYRMAVLLGALGLRFAEVVGLRVGAVDFLRRTITVRATINEVEGRFVEGDGKTMASARTIALPNSLVDELAAHLARTGRTGPDELVLQAPGGGPLGAANFRTRVYGPALARAGLPEGLTFHRLRHSAGFHMREVGAPLEAIQRRLGHRSIRTTADVYGSLPPSVDRAVAAGLDDLFTGRGPHVVPDAGEGTST
jgi:integrase